jgi:hypothetical protein
MPGLGPPPPRGGGSNPGGPPPPPPPAALTTEPAADRRHTDHLLTFRLGNMEVKQNTSNFGTFTTDAKTEEEMNAEVAKIAAHLETSNLTKEVLTTAKVGHKEYAFPPATTIASMRLAIATDIWHRLREARAESALTAHRKVPPLPPPHAEAPRGSGDGGGGGGFSPLAPLGLYIDHYGRTAERQPEDIDWRSHGEDSGPLSRGLPAPPTLYGEGSFTSAAKRQKMDYNAAVEQKANAPPWKPQPTTDLASYYIQAVLCVNPPPPLHPDFFGFGGTHSTLFNPLRYATAQLLTEQREPWHGTFSFPGNVPTFKPPNDDTLQRLEDTTASHGYAAAQRWKQNAISQMGLQGNVAPAAIASQQNATTFMYNSINRLVAIAEKGGANIGAALLRYFAEFLCSNIIPVFTLEGRPPTVVLQLTVKEYCNVLVDTSARFNRTSHGGGGGGGYQRDTNRSEWHKGKIGGGGGGSGGGGGGGGSGFSGGSGPSAPAATQQTRAHADTAQNAQSSTNRVAWGLIARNYDKPVHANLCPICGGLKSAGGHAGGLKSCTQVPSTHGGAGSSWGPRASHFHGPGAYKLPGEGQSCKAANPGKSHAPGECHQTRRCLPRSPPRTQATRPHRLPFAGKTQQGRKNPSEATPPGRFLGSVHKSFERCR